MSGFSYKIIPILFLINGSLSLATPIGLPSITARSLPTITWSNCTAQDPPNLDCGQIQVPIDYNETSGDTVTLTLARLKSSGDGKLGSLLYNPGGPGGAGTTIVMGQALQNVTLFSPNLTDQYDIIGYDPRGVGLSTPVQCNASLFNARIATFVKSQADFDALVASNIAISQSCKNMTGPLFEHLDTINVAKDLDAIRQALGEEKLAFLGQSYGSQIGATYAELFPENVGRFALDGMTDHSSLETAVLNTESQTYELTLNQFFSWCNTTDDCALHGQNAAGIFDTIVSQAAKNPIPAPGCQQTGDSPCHPDVSAEDILYNTQDQLAVVDESPFGVGWAGLSVAIAQAAQGNATLLSTPWYTESSNGNFEFLAVACQDWTHSATTFADLKLKEQMVATLEKHTQGASEMYLAQSRCIGWATPVTNPQHQVDPITAAKVPPMLMVNSLYDPETSTVWANGVKLQFPNSTLIIRNGGGHTSYFVPGDTSAAIDNFLVTGALPAQGTTYNS